MRVRRLAPSDLPHLLALLRGTAEFVESEVACAMELLEIAVRAPDEGDYRGFAAVGGDDLPTGYVVFGPTPMTEGTWDLYWIATRADSRGKGVGKALVDAMEADVREKGGHLVRIETSAADAYGPTRKFYEATRYFEVGRIPNFYRRGDDLVILAKDLEGAGAARSDVAAT